MTEMNFRGHVSPLRNLSSHRPTVNDLSFPRETLRICMLWACAQSPVARGQLNHLLAMAGRIVHMATSSAGYRSATVSKTHKSGACTH